MNRLIGQWSRIESSELDPNTYGYLVYEKKKKSASQNTRVKINFLIKWCWDN